MLVDITGVGHRRRYHRHFLTRPCSAPGWHKPTAVNVDRPGYCSRHTSGEHPAGCRPPAVVSKADELLDNLLQGSPDDQLLMPILAVQRVVVREVETQHEFLWQDATTSTDPVNYSVGVHAELPGLSGRCRWRVSE